MTTKRLIYIFLAILCLGFQDTLFSQQLIKKSLVWPVASTDKNHASSDKVAPFYFEGAYLDHERKLLPYTRSSFRLSSFDLQATLRVLRTETISAPPGSESAEIPAEFDFNYGIGNERKQPVLTYVLYPIRKNPQSGQIERILEYSIELSPAPAGAKRLAASGRTYATNSVLSTGNWYKVGVPNEGIYKITPNLLSRMGMDLNNIDARSIRIYGRAGGMLPQLNSDFRYDDLTEISLYASGEEDGKFSGSDYFLFYAKGPHEWKYNSNLGTFSRNLHAYCDTTYYFITADLNAGKRISDQASAGGAATTVSGYSAYAIHEQELLTGLMIELKSGRRWFGESFEYELNQNFSLNIPNTDLSQPLKVATAIASRSLSQGGRIRTSVNNQFLYDINYPAISPADETTHGAVNIKRDSLRVATMPITVNLEHTKGNAEGNAWLDYIELNARVQPTFSSNPFFFRDTRTIGQNTTFILSNVNAATQVWDISDPVNPKKQSYQLNGEQLSYTLNQDQLKEFVAFKGSDFSEPAAFGKIPNQNLHSAANYDMIIVSPPDFQQEAQRLAKHKKEHDQLEVLIVSPQQVYNEFSAGSRDVTAFRELAKMLYDKGGNNPRIKYMLLMGDGHFDNRGIAVKSRNFIPTYQSYQSLNRVYSYVSDDYLTYMDDNEGAFYEDQNSSDKMDISVGRLPIQSSEEAAVLVDKIIHYSEPASMGDWRNQICLVADDGNLNTHLDQVEELTDSIVKRTKYYNLDKIYLDAYKQVSSPGGNRYPDVNTAINQRINSGALILNYTGHGSELGFAHERVFTISDINALQNYDKLSLFITATCSFTRWDDPNRTSAGELTLLNPKGGAIALFTTSRTVYSAYNKELNEAIIESIFDPAYRNKSMTLGEFYRLGKNKMGPDVNTLKNSRNFSLLGDPSIVLTMPRMNVRTLSINNNSNTSTDTIKALKKITISGEVTDNQGQKLSDFNGIIYPTIYDKTATLRTLGNDDISTLAIDDQAEAVPFTARKNIIYKGKATVSNGSFSFSFITPKDIAYQYGTGRLSYYAQNGELDANGFNDSVVVGGISNTISTDTKGPDLKLYLNDEKFISGSLTNSSPKLIVKLSDESGINTVGNGIGHDLVAVLSKEGQPDQNIVLNGFYQGKLDSYQEGEVSYPFGKLSSGDYTLKVKAWDVYNNSNEQRLAFTVSENGLLAIDRVLNYPNPFSTRTTFQFEHNQAPGTDLNIQVRIYTLSGKLIKTINQKEFASGNLVNDIYWDGRDDFGDRLARGVYVYELRVKTKTGISVEKFEKLVILN